MAKRLLTILLAVLMVATLIVPAFAAGPTITTQPKSTSVVEGKTATFKVVASGSDLTYQWQYRKSGSSTWYNSTSSGNKTATLSVEATTARDGMQFRCKVTNASGTTTSNAAKLTVKPLPVITTQPASKSVAEGATAKFKVVASGTDLTYQWQYRKSGSSTWYNSTSTGNKTATLSVEATTARNGMLFRCKVTNANGTVTSGTAKLTVTAAAKPTITTQPASKTVAMGASVTFKVVASGSGLSYQWQYKSPSMSSWKNTTVSGAKTASITMTATTERNGNQYRCIVSNANGSVTSSAAKLTLLTAPTITTQPASAYVVLGKTATFKVVASGSGLTYQWQYKKSGSSTWYNSTSTGNKTATLSVEATEARDKMQFRCKVSNSAGDTFSSAAFLMTITKPTIKTQPKSATVAEGATAAFKVTAEGRQLTYQWQYKAPGSSTWNDSGMSGAKTATLTVTATMARSGQQYRCKISNAAGSVTSNAVTLTVYEVQAPIILTQPASITVNSGEKATFRVEAYGTDLEYQWQYKFSDSVGWSDNCEPGCLDAEFSVYPYYDMNGVQYRCVVSNAGGAVVSDAATLTVIEPDPPAFTNQPSDSRMEYGSTSPVWLYARATGAEDYLTLEWYELDETGPTPVTTLLETDYGTSTSCKVYHAPRTYYCVATDIYGKKTESRHAFVDYTPHVTTTCTPENCVIDYDNNGVTISVSVECCSPPYHYQWYYGNDDSPIEGATESTYVATHATERYRNYYCTITDAKGHTTNSYYIDVTDSRTELRITQQPQSGSIRTSTGSFSAVVKAEGGRTPYTYEFYRNGSLYKTQSTGSLDITLSGSWFVRVKDSAGNHADTASFTVRPMLKITSQPKNGTITEAGGSVTLSVTAADGDSPYEYRWYRDGSYISFATDSTYRATVPGSYTVKVVDRSGNSVTSNAAVVDSALMILSQPDATVLIDTETEGTYLTIEAAGGQGTISYQWQRWNESSKTWNNFKTGSTVRVEGSQEGKYRCVVSDQGGGEVYSRTITVKINRLEVSIREMETVWNGVVSKYTITITGGRQPYEYEVKWLSKSGNYVLVQYMSGKQDIENGVEMYFTNVWRHGEVRARVIDANGTEVIAVINEGLKPAQ